jgi:NAD(P)-dependent dehydrogenase (short-subunit alcohol dehydrogenase family)
MHFGVNHLAHFLVQDSLSEAMRSRARSTGVTGRIVACSSIANMLPGALDIDDLDWRRRESRYEKWAAYAASKAENVLLTDEFARRESRFDDGDKKLVVANAFHPGIVTTNLVRYVLPKLTAENRDPATERKTPQGKAMSKMGIRDADEGAKTHVWLSTSKEAGEVSGRFFVDPGVEYPADATRDQLVKAQDWFLVAREDPLAKQLHLPERFFEWRTPDNARSLWTQSQEMTDAFKVA